MRHLPLAIVALSAAAAAQGVTSPNGFQNIEGNAAFIHWGGSRRFQQVDYSNAGTTRVISSIAWRRNGGSSGSVGTRTFDLQIDLGENNFAVVSHLLDENFLPGSRTTVFNQTGVNFPDWSAALPGPTPFDFAVTLGVPWVYLGVNALVIDFSYLNSTGGSLSTDREFVGPTTPPAGTSLGTGCIATGRAAAFAHTAHMSNQDALPTPAYGLRLRLGGSNAPAGGPVLALIDATNLALSGLLCSTLYPAPTIMVPMTALSTGLVPDVNLQFSHHPSLVGLTLYTQLAGVDPGQVPLPIAVSNGRQTTMGAPVSGMHRCSYGWYSLPSTTGTATHFIGGGMVMLLQ